MEIKKTLEYDEFPNSTASKHASGFEVAMERVLNLTELVNVPN
jgi:hypothetical protein